MKKMLISAIIINVILSIILVIAVTQLSNGDIIKVNEKYVVKDKLYGEPEVLTHFITPEQTAIQLQAKELKKDNDMATVTATYDWLETNYHYEVDKIEIINNGHTVLKGSCDTWNLPIFSLAIRHQNGGFYGDCEDGTFLLVSLLRANGIQAWAHIGTVEINGSIYGHAWATVVLNGQEFLLETTLGQTIQSLRPVPDFYTPSFTFNESKVIPTKFGADINEVYPTLPPSKIQDLKNLLT